jgi:KUP system potassium uptake protein
VFLTAEPGTVPNALLHNLKHNKVLHATTCSSPCATTRCPGSAWTSARDRGPGPRLLAGDLHYGFKNDPDVPKALQLLKDRGAALDR